MSRSVFWFSVFAAVVVIGFCALFATGEAKSAVAVMQKQVAVYFRGDPSCVHSKERVTYPLVAKNLSHKQQDLTIRILLGYPGSLHGVTIAGGTSHLEGPRGFEHWTIRLAPGKSVAKKLAILVPDIAGMQMWPLSYSVTVQVYAGSGLDTYEFPVTAMAPYCAVG
jgi:hypothetical protein